MKRYSVLSFIVNNYEAVKEIEELDPEAEYILVTDDPNLTSSTWQVIYDNTLEGTPFDKCLSISYNSFNYCSTDICIRIDGSIQIKHSLKPLIDKFLEKDYDICLMPHPNRETFNDEYDAWISMRGYNPSQADKCLEYYKNHNYDLNYKGLLQTGLSIVKNTKLNKQIDQETLSLLKELGEDDTLERIDQIVYSYILNTRYSNLKVLPVSEQILRSYYMQIYFHGDTKLQNLNAFYDLTKPDKHYLFNKLVTCEYLLTPEEGFSKREQELQEALKITQQSVIEKEYLQDILSQKDNHIGNLETHIVNLSRKIAFIADHSFPFFKIINRDDPFKYNQDITYCVDNTVCSFKHLVINGWVVSSNGDIKLSTRATLKKRQYSRDDINKQNQLDKGYLSGFEVSGCPLLPLRIKFQDANNHKQVYYVNGFKLYIKYIGKSGIKFVKSLKENGIKVTGKKIIYRILGKNTAAVTTEDYNKWFLNQRVTKDTLEIQKNTHFEYEPLISIVVPTFNTPKRLLVEMIESIRNQSYANWELCIADGHSELEETISTLKSYEKKDSRILVQYLQENYMISGNTNKAIEMCQGEFVGLMDHDDLLEPNALYEYIKVLNEKSETDFLYCDEDKIDEESKTYFGHYFKPDFSLDTLRENNYITHFSVIRKSVLDQVGYYDASCDGAQDFDMTLRVVDYTKNIAHIAKPLYHWRVTTQSTAGGVSVKPYIIEAGRNAIKKHLERNNLKGEVLTTNYPGWYRIKYEIIGKPLVSIIIPNKDHIDDLDKCLSSILNLSTYDNYEIIVVENNSEEDETFEYYKQYENHKKVRVIYYKDTFNYSKINNFGRTHVKGKHLLLLNNDIEVISPNWIEEMLMFSQRDDIGAVGAKLYYSDDTIQHAGVILGIGGVAGHVCKYFDRTSPGYACNLITPRNYSCVTAACLMIKASIYDEVQGLDEGYAVAFNDIDFCMKIREKGYNNIFTPYAELYHYESKSRGEEDNPEKIARFNGEIERFQTRWHDALVQGDPYYNKNLTITMENYSLYHKPENIGAILPEYIESIEKQHE